MVGEVATTHHPPQYLGQTNAGARKNFGRFVTPSHTRHANEDADNLIHPRCHQFGKSGGVLPHSLPSLSDGTMRPRRQDITPSSKHFRTSAPRYHAKRKFAAWWEPDPRLRSTSPGRFVLPANRRRIVL